VLARSEHEAPLDARDVIFAEDIARRCALAVENASLFQESKAAVHARDEFIAIAAHELRTPLAALKLQHQSLSRLLRRPPEHPEAQEKVARAERQTSRLSWLVESLLDVGRLHTRRMELERQEVDLGELVYEVTEHLSGELERAGCALTVSAEPHVTGFWDRGRLQQALTSLLNNALKFGAGHPIDIAVFQREGRARLVVTDRGIGVAPEALERIFGRFERAVSSREYGGLGLGLYLTRRIAEAHGGTIHVASAPGSGASFILELPVTPREPAYALEPLPTHHA
jgi:signal transduction histidine kinase